MKGEWDIRNEGRSWRGDEAQERYFMKPHKIEMVDGKLVGSDQDIEVLLCLLLENIGADRVVQFGDPGVWRAAVAKLDHNAGR